MTKKIRIENADNSNHKVAVQTWTKGQDGKPDVMVRQNILDHPTDIIDGWVWSNQYLVIQEVE